VLTDYISPDSFQQNIRIERITNPYAVYFDPGAKQDDKQDGQYMFLIQDLTKEDYKAQYGNDPVDFEVDGTELASWISGENVRIAEYFYREKTGTKTIYLLDDGSIVDDLPEGVTAKRERKVVIEEIRWCKVDGKRILEGPKKVAGTMFPLIVCWGKQLCVDGKIEVRGIARHSKDAQRLYNYYRTIDAEVVALQPTQPYLMPDICLGPYEERWNEAANENYFYLPYKVDLAQPHLKPQREQPPAASGGTIEQVRLADQEMRDTVGIQKAALGMESNETSGIAITKRKMETDTGQYAFVDNIADAVRTTGKIIVRMIPEVYDVEQQLRILGKDMKEKVVRVNQLGGIDLTTGIYDVDVDTGPSYSTQREEFIEKMGAILPSIPPEQTAVITDILFSSMDMPRADDIAERIKKLIPPQILGNEQDPSQGGGQNATGQPPPVNSPPPPPEPDPIIELQLRTARAKMQQEELRAEQEKAKLALLQVEIGAKHATGVENIKQIIAEMMAEGGPTNAVS
jgi:hypothetical protein